MKGGALRIRRWTLAGVLVMMGVVVGAWVASYWWTGQVQCTYDVVFTPASRLKVKHAKDFRARYFGVSALHGVVAIEDQAGAHRFSGLKPTMLPDQIAGWRWGVREAAAGSPNLLLLHSWSDALNWNIFGFGVNRYPTMLGNVHSLSIPFWLIAAVLGMAAIRLWMPIREETKRAKAGRCARCNYDRAGLANDAPCPECGARAKRAGDGSAVAGG